MDPFQNEIFIEKEPYGLINPPFWFWNFSNSAIIADLDHFASDGMVIFAASNARSA